MAYLKITKRYIGKTVLLFVLTQVVMFLVNISYSYFNHMEYMRNYYDFGLQKQVHFSVDTIKIEYDSYKFGLCFSLFVGFIFFIGTAVLSILISELILNDTEFSKFRLKYIGICVVLFTLVGFFVSRILFNHDLFFNLSFFIAFISLILIINMIYRKSLSNAKRCNLR